MHESECICNRFGVDCNQIGDSSWRPLGTGSIRYSKTLQEYGIKQKAAIVEYFSLNCVSKQRRNQHCIFPDHVIVGCWNCESKYQGWARFLTMFSSSFQEKNLLPIPVPQVPIRSNFRNKKIRCRSSRNGDFWPVPKIEFCSPLLNTNWTTNHWERIWSARRRISELQESGFERKGLLSKQNRLGNWNKNRVNIEITNNVFKKLE